MKKWFLKVLPVLLVAIVALFTQLGSVVSNSQLTQIFTQVKAVYAWDCGSGLGKYSFTVKDNGDVIAANLSGANEGAQQANVSINGSSKGTLDVPALSAGQSATIGHVDLPEGKFTWEVVGSQDCRNSGTGNHKPGDHGGDTSSEFGDGWCLGASSSAGLAPGTHFGTWSDGVVLNGYVDVSNDRVNVIFHDGAFNGGVSGMNLTVDGVVFFVQKTDAGQFCSLVGTPPVPQPVVAEMLTNPDFCTRPIWTDPLCIGNLPITALTPGVGVVGNSGTITTNGVVFRPPVGCWFITMTTITDSDFLSGTQPFRLTPVAPWNAKQVGANRCLFDSENQSVRAVGGTTLAALIISAGRNTSTGIANFASHNGGSTGVIDGLNYPTAWFDAPA